MQASECISSAGTEDCGLQLGPTLRERIELQPSP